MPKHAEVFEELCDCLQRERQQFVVLKIKYALKKTTYALRIMRCEDAHIVAAINALTSCDDAIELSSHNRRLLEVLCYDGFHMFVMYPTKQGGWRCDHGWPSHNPVTLPCDFQLLYVAKKILNLWAKTAYEDEQKKLADT